uniref:Variant surface glycoprotein 374 n=1 Tax=Trypanosoma brucei TaxID=5691 RepID=M4TD41_9TRYP|nr:variant surface glycoprotein 374 [Trypanosoma brucei]
MKQEVRIQATLKFTFAACGLMALQLAAGTGDGPEKTANEQANDICGADIYYKHVKAELKRWVEAKAQTARNLASEARLLNLATTLYKNTPKALAYKFLATLAADKAQEAAAQAEEAQTTTARALEAIAQRHGEHLTFAALATSRPVPGKLTHAKADGRNVLIATGTTSAKCTATYTPTPQYSTECDPADAKYASIKSIRSHLADAKKLMLGNDQAFKPPSTTVQFEGAGDLGTGSNWALGSGATHCGDEVAKQADRAAKAIAVTGVATSTPHDFTAIDLQEAASTQPANHDQRNGKQTQYFVANKDIAEAVVAAQRIAKTNTLALAKETIQNLATTKAAQAFYTHVSDQKSKHKQSPAAGPTVAEAIFGKKEGSIQNEFLDPLTRDSHTIPTDGGAIKGSTQKLAEDNFARAMAYYYSENMKKAAATAGGNPKADGQAATGEDKKEEKKDGDNKTSTETTGSNSFVIKTSHLLLAFLLF